MNIFDGIIVILSLVELSVMSDGNSCPVCLPYSGGSSELSGC